MPKVTIHQDQMHPADRVELEVPLTSRVVVDDLRRDLGISDWVDIGYFHMKRAVVILWASQNVTRLNQMLNGAKISDRPMNLALLGGAAFKMHCRSSNVAGGPLDRPVNDLDFVMESKRSGDVKKLLLSLGDALGSEFTHFMTSFDRRWTALRGGRRILIRALDISKPDEAPQITSMDVIADRLELCHIIDLRDALREPRENVYTIGLENLLLSKCQFITCIPSSDLGRLKEAQQDFRLLDYGALNDDRVVIGMESKDMKDVCALLLDHEFGEGNDELNLGYLSRVLGHDEKFALTVKLNLSNIRRNSALIRSWGVVEADLQRIEIKLDNLLSAIREPGKKWSKPWWNIDVETPKVHL